MDGDPTMNEDSQKVVSFTVKIPPIKPVWVAWVTGQFLFCLGITVAFVPEDRLATAYILAGLSFMLDCIIVVIAKESKK